MITADATGDLGIEPGSANLVVASCVANNMLNEIAGPCPVGDADMVGYAVHFRPLPLLDQGLLAAGGLPGLRRAEQS